MENIDFATLFQGIGHTIDRITDDLDNDWYEQRSCSVV